MGNYGGNILFLWDEDTDLFIDVYIDGSLDFPNIDDFVDPFYNNGNALDVDVNAYTDELLNWRSNLGQLTSRKLVIEDVVTITSDQPVSLSQIGSISDLFEGDTVVNGTQFNDILRGDADGQTGNDTINGGDGGDTIFGDPGADTINGGGGIDVLTYGLSTSGIGLNLGSNAASFGDAAGDKFSEIEAVVGSKHNDEMDLGNNTVLAIGNGGSDKIIGSNSDDSIYGDFLSSEGTPIEDVLANLILANAELGGSAAGDFLYGGPGYDRIFGGDGNDWIYAGEFAVLMTNDTSGNELYGQGDDDQLFAWTSSQTTVDQLDGGAGNDTYYADGMDIITEFELGEVAFYRTNSLASLTLFVSDATGSRATFFGSNSPVAIGSLDFGNSVLASDVTISDSSIGALTSVRIERTADNLDFVTEQRAKQIAWEYSSEQIAVVAKAALNLVISGAFDRYAGNVGQVLRPYLENAGASPASRQLVENYVSRVSSDFVGNVLADVSVDAAAGDAKPLSQYITAADVAKILVKNSFGAAVSRAIEVGDAIANLVYLEIGKQFSLFMNDLFPNQDSQGIFLLNSNNGKFEAASGTVTDGFISGSTVFGDANENGFLDEGEVFSVTDGSGSFALVDSSGPIVATGGIDVATGLPFFGKLVTPAGGTVVTPLSTLAYSLSGLSANDPNEVLSSALGLTGTLEFETNDPVDLVYAGATGAVVIAQTQSALMNTVQLIAAAFAGQRDPDENADAVYEALAQTLQTVAVMDLASSGFIKSVLDTFAQSPAIAASDAFLTTLSEIIAASNQQTFDVAAGTDVLAFFGALGTVGRAAQGAVADAVEAAAGDAAALLAAKDATTGQSLADLIADAGDELLGAPTDILLDSFFANEGLAGGSTVASITVLDPDPLDTHTLSIVSANLDNPFELDGKNLILGPGGSLNADIQDSFDITLRAEDGDGNTLDKMVTLFVGETGLDLVFGGALAENSAAGTAAAVFGTNGSLLGATPVYSLIDDAGGLFELQDNTLVVADGASLDFETQQSHTVTVRAQEGSAPPEDRNFVIQVQDRPISDIAISSGGIVRETDTAGTLVAIFEASENPVEPTAVFTLIEDGDGSFVLNGNQLEVAPGATFDFDTQSNYIVKIGASDPGGPVFEESFDILVQNVGPIVGTPDPDVLNGTAFDDDIRALSSDDTINGSAGSDEIDGGEGNDMVSYADGRAGYTQTLLPNGTITLDKPGGETDTLTHVERIDFTDGDYVYDLLSPNLGYVYRVYEAAFNRTPDEGGLRFWLGEADLYDQLGWSEFDKQHHIARIFNESLEFRLIFGEDTTNLEYVDAMYRNVLNRPPDQAGYDYWTGRMDDGLSREEILVFFAESPENRIFTDPEIDNGVWVV